MGRIRLPIRQAIGNPKDLLEVEEECSYTFSAPNPRLR